MNKISLLDPLCISIGWNEIFSSKILGFKMVQKRSGQGAPNDHEYDRRGSLNSESVWKQENNKILWSAKPLPTGGTE